MHRPSVASLLITAGLLLSSQTLLNAQTSSALINAALDKQVNLEFPTNTPLPKVMEAITRDTGVPLKASDDLYELLPWGEQTGLSVKSQNQTLREALNVITPRLGMTYVLTDQAIELQPMPALKRLGKRATVEELEVLDLLSRTPAGISGDRVPVSKVLEAVDKKLEELKSPFAVENRALDRVPGSTPVTIARNATLLEALEAIPQYTGATWSPWGKTLVVVAKEDHVRNQLARTITVRYNDAELVTVLDELSKRAGVPFTTDAGALQQVSPEYRTVKLVFDNVPIRQALDNISAITGLAYTIDGNGVHLAMPSATADASKAAARDPVLAIVKLENGMELLLPTSQVPEDVREYIKSKVDQTVAALRKQMDAEGFKPTTKPATQPAAEDL